MENKNLKDFKIYKIYTTSDHPSLWIAYDSNMKRVEVKYDGLMDNEEKIDSVLKTAFKNMMFENVKDELWTFATNIDLDDKKDLDNFVNTLAGTFLQVKYLGDAL